MEENKDFEKSIPVNLRDFILSYSDNPEDHGWNRDDVIEILTYIKEGREDELNLEDSNLVNDIGTFFDDGVCTPADIYKAGHGMKELLPWVMI